MQKSTPLGLVAGLGIVYGAIFLGKGWATFFDPASGFIVLGGTFAALLVNFTSAELKAVPAGLKDFLAFTPPDLSGRVAELVDLARKARREGLLALDRQLGQTEDPLLRLGLEMAVDGVDPAEIDEMMRTHIAEGARPRRLLNRVFTSAANYAPAFGMIGTLIGLIQMLQNLTDPSAIGPAMAVALITTFYGALLANLFCLPIAAKVKEQMVVAAKTGEVTRLGILGIARGDGPTLLEKRLLLFVEGKATAAEAEELAPALKQAA